MHTSPHRRPRTSAAVLAALLAPLLPGQDDLDRARALLAGRLEKEVQEGTKLCVDRGDVPAVELLLEVLCRTGVPPRNFLSPGHYRDIVWDGLAAVTDIYARERVAVEVRKNDDPDVRQWCAELLGIYGEAKFGDVLRKALRDRQDHVKRAAVRSLGMMRYEPAAGDVARLVGNSDEFIRANAVEALARINPTSSLEPLVTAIAEDADGGVRCALLGAAPELLPDRVEALSVTALRDADWRPRMQAVQNLGRIKTRGAVDALITALADGRPVVAARALRELQELTGQPIEQPAVWKQWWADNRESFAFPESRGARKQAAGTVTYNGVPIESDHAAFLLDKSFRMRERLTSRSQTKREAALAEFERVLELLEDKMTCNVFNYAEAVDAMAKKPVALTERNRKKAIQFAGADADGRQKDIWQVLELVVSDPTLDTAYLLSSGEPDIGRYVHWNRVTRHLADLNRFHKVTVHCVAYTDSEWFQQQLEKIAEVTGGHFEVVK